MSNEEVPIKGSTTDGAHQYSSEKQTVAMYKPRDLSHHPSRALQKASKGWGVNGELEVSSGDRAGYV